MIFVGLFVYLYEGYILAQELIWYTISLGVVGYLVWERSKPDRRLARAFHLLLPPTWSDSQKPFKKNEDN